VVDADEADIEEIGLMMTGTPLSTLREQQRTVEVEKV
jgi:hypothetical protein